MLNLIFLLCMIFVFGSLLKPALKGAWGLTKIIFTLVFFPLFLIWLLFKGLMAIAIPALVIFAVVYFIGGLLEG